MREIVFVLFAAAVALGCAPPDLGRRPAPLLPQLAQTATGCTEPRPQMCAQVYQPVCGTRRDGTRQTYGNACSACADANVVSHVPGPC